MLIVGFPLGFSDTLHKLPVVRHAINASSFVMRFQGNGYFLTDARTHRGSSGAPVVCLDHRSPRNGMGWILLGVHSARLDVSGRDVAIDEALGLNCRITSYNVCYTKLLRVFLVRQKKSGTR